MNQSLTINNTRGLLSKVPEMTLIFWITKILTTGMGEVFSDYLALNFNPVIAVMITGLVLVATLVLQFRVNRYIAWIYWLTVVMVSIFGTMAADVVHVVLGYSICYFNDFLYCNIGCCFHCLVCR